MKNFGNVASKRDTNNFTFQKTFYEIKSQLSKRRTER